MLKLMGKIFLQFYGDFFFVYVNLWFMSRDMRKTTLQLYVTRWLRSA